MDEHFIFILISLFLMLSSQCSSGSQPYSMRISCGALANVRTQPTNTLWYKDFGYTGGISSNGTRSSFIAPPLTTIRYFPLSEGAENCYIIDKLQNGHYLIRIFLGLLDESKSMSEPLFDISIERTQIDSLRSGWSSRDDESFVEALVFVTDDSASLCFHGTGHGDPSILSIEILQVDDRSYNFGTHVSNGIIFRTVKRLSCGNKLPMYGVDYNASPWGGDRYWKGAVNLNSIYDKPLDTKNKIINASVEPNFYPEGIYQTAIRSSDDQPNLEYTLDVDPNRNYSIWLHFSEIDSTVTGPGQRVFDILINGDIAFKAVDIVELSGDVYSALVLNKTLSINGRTLEITMRPLKGDHAIISAIEVFEVIIAESETLPSEVTALQTLKTSLGLPIRLGWNGDPCVPQQHSWSGVNCQYDTNSGNWVIDGLGLDVQGLRGVLPDEISQLPHLLSLNLSRNSIHGVISPFIGNLTLLEILDLSYNSFNGSIPGSFEQLSSLQRLYLNGNSLSGKVPDALGERLLHRASYNFTDNSGLCGIPGLHTCGPHISSGEKAGISLGVCVGLLLGVIGLTCYWKRRQNILRVQRIAARDAPYAKARTHFSRDVQMAKHHAHDHTNRSPTESGPILP